MTFSSAGICLEQAKKLHADEMNERVQCEFPLNEDSVVFDVGAYDGDWTARLIKWHGFVPNLFLFEPVHLLFQRAMNRFSSSKKVSFFNYGLSDKDSYSSMRVDATDPYQTGEFVEAGETVTAYLRDVADVVKDFSRIDLMAVNIEGGEYKMLSRLIDSGEISKVKNLLVQFHNVVPNAKHLREELCDRLFDTHGKLHTYPFAWDSWVCR